MPPAHRIRRVRPWLLAGSILFASGCALVSGLDQYEKGDAESPDATPDQTVSDVATDTAKDTGNDTSTSDSSSDVVTSDVQDGGAGDAEDAADGCGPLNTVDNCSMCGAVCDGGNATTTGCNGTTCQYTCKAGYANCATTAPDLNGCECATPTCCGSSCATTHMNGVGQNYYDCVDAGTYNQTQAAKACTAYTNDQFACQQFGCQSDAGDQMICGNPDGGGCTCWTYVGLDIGHVYQSGTPSPSGCFCPSTNDKSWN